MWVTQGGVVLCTKEEAAGTALADLSHVVANLVKINTQQVTKLFSTVLATGMQGSHDTRHLICIEGHSGCRLTKTYPCGTILKCKK
jgi:hypothetical protein